MLHPGNAGPWSKKQQSDPFVMAAGVGPVAGRTFLEEVCNAQVGMGGPGSNSPGRGRQSHLCQLPEGDRTVGPSQNGNVYVPADRRRTPLPQLLPVEQWEVSRPDRPRGAGAFPRGLVLQLTDP